MKTRFLLFLLFCAIAELYSFVLIRSVVRSLSPLWRSLTLIAYVGVSIAVWAGIIFIKQINWAELPSGVRNFIIAFTFGFFIAKILMAAVMLIDDLRRFFVWAGLGIFPERNASSSVTGNGISRSVFLKRIALLLGGTTLSGFVYGISNRYNYQVVKQQIKIPHLPEPLRGLKILHISDIHSGSFDNIEAVTKGVVKAMELKPDIIFFTGDLVNDRASEVLPYIPVFSALQAPMGVYSVLGNHDYGDYVSWPSAQAKQHNLEQLIAAHGKMGWKLLNNEHVVLEKQGAKIAIIGVENWSEKAHFPRHGNLQIATQGLNKKEVACSILLSHDPSHWDAEVRSNFPEIDLTLSGHTHGMQFGIEIPGFKWSPVKYMYPRWAGHYQQGNQQLYVNRGFGFLGYPGRLGILPEITLLELS